MAKKKRNQFDVDEIYRGLRTNIEFSQMDYRIQVINVVSIAPNGRKKYSIHEFSANHGS